MKLNEIIEVPVNAADVRVQKENILELLGYSTNAADFHVHEVIDLCLDQSKDMITPRGGFIIAKNDQIIVPEGKLYINNEVFNINKIIAGQIRSAEFIALFACTIGNEVEQHSKKYMEKSDLLEGYIFDLIGSEAAEETARVIHESIKRIVSKSGYKITNRFSPGYCNWSVSEQFKLFESFGEKRFGIKLTDSALMNPVKSVSGIVGIGENVRFKPYTCNLCTDEKCIYRNRKSRA